MISSSHSSISQSLTRTNISIAQLRYDSRLELTNKQATKPTVSNKMCKESQGPATIALERLYLRPTTLVPHDNDDYASTSVGCKFSDMKGRDAFDMSLLEYATMSVDDARHGSDQQIVPTLVEDEDEPFPQIDWAPRELEPDDDIMTLSTRSEHLPRVRHEALDSMSSHYGDCHGSKRSRRQRDGLRRSKAFLSLVSFDPDMDDSYSEKYFGLGNNPKRFRASIA